MFLILVYNHHLRVFARIKENVNIITSNMRAEVTETNWRWRYHFCTHRDIGLAAKSNYDNRCRGNLDCDIQSTQCAACSSGELEGLGRFIYSRRPRHAWRTRGEAPQR